jgi:predicted LPLAT superfamily acyltransferase
MSTPAPRTAAGWTAERERSNLWALRLMRWIAITAGRPRARLVLHPIALYFLLVHGKARRASLNYLVRVLGRPVGWRDAYRHIHHFAATILDRVYFLQDQFDRFEVSATGAEALHAPLDRGEGVMLVGAHLGSFEALRASAQGRGARVAMLMYEDNARLLNATLAAVAPHAELHTIGLGRAGAMLTLRRWLDDGGIAGLLADRTLPGHSERSRTLWLDFLGQPARFSDGPFRLAAMLRRQVVFMAGLYHGGDRYELRFVELADFRAPAPGPADRGTGAADPRIAEAMQRYVTLLESLCRETPYNWFNFFDFWSADDAAAPASP